MECLGFTYRIIRNALRRGWGERRKAPDCEWKSGIHSHIWQHLKISHCWHHLLQARPLSGNTQSCVCASVRVCVCDSVWKCLILRVCVCMHALFHVCVHACNCMCLIIRVCYFLLPALQPVQKREVKWPGHWESRGLWGTREIRKSDCTQRTWPY